MSLVNILFLTRERIVNFPNQIREVLFTYLFLTTHSTVDIDVWASMTVKSPTHLWSLDRLHVLVKFHINTVPSCTHSVTLK